MLIRDVLLVFFTILLTFSLGARRSILRPIADPYIKDQKFGPRKTAFEDARLAANAFYCGAEFITKLTDGSFADAEGLATGVGTSPFV
jgi:hypothetical protein